MLLTLHRLALRLQFLRPVCAAVAGGGIAASVFLLAGGGTTPTPSLGAVLALTVWSLLCYAFIQLFRAIPPPVLPLDSLFDRIKAHIRLGLYHLLALAVVAAGLVLLSVTLKLLSAGTA
jgi:hypothetical protein